MKSQRTRKKILSAAERVFSRRGFDGATMDEIAARAGVEKANLYYYFRGKRQLYRALIDHILMQLVGDVQQHLSAPAASPWQRLDDFLDVFFRSVEAHESLIGLAFDELLHPPKGGPSLVVQMFDQVEDIGMQLIREGIAAGEFRAQDPAQLVLTCEGAVFFYFLQPEARLTRLLGSGKLERQSLAKRKQALSAQIRRLLET
jgi:TetR/AcrR family transcriptional regulator